MWNLLYLPIAILASVSCSSIGRGSPVCLDGAVKDSDLASGELLLNDTDVFKVPLADQKTIETSFRQSPVHFAGNALMERYGLKHEPHWTWIAVKSVGFFGRNSHEAEYNFIHSDMVQASYYPASKKIVVFTSIPRPARGKLFEFWVLVHVPQDVREAKVECGEFE
jgi:hypothetical protein